MRSLLSLAGWLVLVFAIALTTPLIAIFTTTNQAGAGHAGELTLTILHTNDFHARLAPVTFDGSRCRPSDSKAHLCYGGIARLATEIERVRASRPHTLLVDAGDRFQGSLYYNTYKSAALKPFFSLLGYQAMTLGNHEFDEGPEELARFLSDLAVPVISANVDVSAEPLLAKRIGATLILNVGGERVGLIGLTTPTTTTSAKPGPNVHFTDPVEAARAGVSSLRNQGVNKIIAISHLGIAEDRKLAATVDGVAVIIGGHSHTLLRSNDKHAVGSAPMVVKSPSGKTVLIVQAYTAGIYLGVLRVEFDKDGTATSLEGEPILLDDSIPENTTARAFVEALSIPLQAELNKKVGELATALPGGAACRFSECGLGNLITDSMVEQTKSQGTQIAVINGGGIRTGLPAGQVTRGEVLEVLPFANTISTFDLLGSDLRAALEYGLSRADNPGNDGTGRFLQVSGLRYSWDVTAPPGQRIVSVKVSRPDGSESELIPTATYHTATIDFLRTGGDGYTVFHERAINAYDGGALISDALINYLGVNYLGANSPAPPDAKGRIMRSTPKAGNLH
ncbi:MAG: 5'-nucleotidase C-terminal domain-containing protein [Rhodospirillaceae bacterium]